MDQVNIQKKHKKCYNTCCTYNIIYILGKSNLMDAISFVLGVNSNQLRSSHLVDLINRRSDSEIAKSSTSTSTTGNKKRAIIKEKGAQKTSVSAHYSRNNNEELIFSRRYTEKFI